MGFVESMLSFERGKNVFSVCVWHEASFFRKCIKNPHFWLRQNHLKNRFFPFECAQHFAFSWFEQNRNRNRNNHIHGYYAKCNALRRKRWIMASTKHVTSQSIECIELEICKSYCIVIRACVTYSYVYNMYIVFSAQFSIYL